MTLDEVVFVSGLFAAGLPEEEVIDQLTICRVLDSLDVAWPENELDPALKTAGGPGSGNHGHDGRPGSVGGSSTDDLHASKPRDRSSWTEYTDSTPYGGVILGATSRSDLPFDQHVAVHDYVVIHSFDINRALRAGGMTYPEMRNGKPVGIGHVNPSTLEHMDKAVQTDISDRDLLVYRSVDEGVFPSTIGTVFSDLAYCSTSTNKDKADFIGQMFATKPTTWTIDVPKGSRFLDVPKHFEPDTDTQDEDELLFGRNQRFEVIGLGRLRIVQ
jgi:hypothetical protein